MSDAKKIWLKLSKMGNFGDKFYDREIETDLKIKLGISVSKSLNDHLDNVAVEDLLKHFLEAISPLQNMYIDILNLFKECQAKSSDENIKIAIELDKIKSKVDFDLFQFIETVEKQNNLSKSMIQVDLTRNLSYMMWSVLPRKLPEEGIKNKRFNKWYALYKEGDRLCPKYELDFLERAKEFVDREKVDIISAYTCWKAFFDYYSKYDMTRKEWHRSSLREEGKPDFENVETDYLLGTVLKGLYIILENYRHYDKNKQEEIKNNLNEFKPYVKENVITNTLSELEDLLTLPTWKYRHELYSVWIFAKIVNKIPYNYLSYQIRDGALSFPFSGAKLAEVQLMNEQFDIWTERRMKATVRPIGKGRTRGIQPDYSIFHREECVVSIECKQYKRPNYKNFSNAIIDYGNNCPTAKILFVNYGTFNIKTLKNKVTLDKDRYLLYPCYQPKNSTENFSIIIWELLREKANINFKVEGDISIDFRLEWGSRPKDLDLHLSYTSLSSSHEKEVNYRSREIEYVTLSDDIRGGYGPEIITIKKLKKGIYNLWVKNYSNEACLSKSRATLSIYVNKVLIEEIECPETSTREKWDVLKLKVTEDMEVIFDYLVNNKQEKTNPRFFNQISGEK